MEDDIYRKRYREMIFPHNQFEDFQWSIIGAHTHTHCSILHTGGSSIKEGLQALYKDAGLGGGTSTEQTDCTDGMVLSQHQLIPS